MKKTLLFILLSILLAVQVFAQNQISELSRGLIFHWAGSEWFPNQDLISGQPGTGTDIFNIADRQGSGRRYIDNVNTGYASLADDARYDFGTGDFTLIVSFTPTNITDNGKYIISKEAGGIGYGLYQQGNDLYVRIDDNTHDASGIIGTDILVAGTKITCEVVFNRAGNAVLYLNGSASSSGTLAISTVTGSLDNTGAFVVGNIEAHNQGFTGQIHFARAFNFALTSQIVNYAKAEYPIEATHRGAGATKNVLDLNSEGIGRQNISTRSNSYWWDATNNVAATVSGATVVIPPASCLGTTWFNGATSKIIISGVPTLALGATDRTLSVWICPQSFSNMKVMGYGTSTAGYGSYIGISASAKFNFGNSQFNSSPESSTTLTANTWYHLCLTFSGGTVKYYLNGVYDGTGTVANTNTQLGSFYIGSFLDGASYMFSGAISNAAVYSSVFQPDQIKLLYDLGH